MLNAPSISLESPFDDVNSVHRDERRRFGSSRRRSKQDYRSKLLGKHPKLRNAREREKSTVFNRVDQTTFIPTFTATRESYPPANIKKFWACSAHKEANGALVVSLRWNDVGAHLDADTASSTELRASLDKKAFSESFESGLQVNQEDLVSGHLTPLPPFSRHNVVVSVPKKLHTQHSGGEGTPGNPVIYFALRIWNAENRTSEPSHLVRVDFGYPPTSCPDDKLLPSFEPEPEVTATTARKADATTTRTPIRIFITDPPPSASPFQEKKSNTGLLVGIAALGGFFVLLVLCVHQIISRRRLQQEESPDVGAADASGFQSSVYSASNMSTGV